MFLDKSNHSSGACWMRLISIFSYVLTIKYLPRDVIPAFQLVKKTPTALLRVQCSTATLQSDEGTVSHYTSQLCSTTLLCG